MYLKSLEVKGFKSFANKLNFEFHNGITAVVGPNGSGKSNVADAVRWVLGEQSASKLRGSSMQDVIFSGTELKKPLGYAYVAITFSNEDHKLQVPYEEVTVARRVYRSGESEYLLNGTNCRLKDIQEMLFDTGIGKEGYSIIGQGQIDKILSGKADERRELFDEAAGIVKFKKRKAATEKNLYEEQQNLIRIEDILSELEIQVGPINEEAKKAKQYLEYREELKVSDINMFLNEYDTGNEKLEEIEKNKSINEDDIAEKNAKLEESKEKFEEIDGDIKDNENLLLLTKDKISQEEIKVSDYSHEIDLLNEQIKNVIALKETFTARKNQLENDIKARKESYDKFDEDKKKLIVEEKNSGIEKENLNKKEEELKAKIKEINEKIEKINEEKLDYINNSTNVMADKKEFDTRLEQNNISRARVQSRILNNKSEASKIEDTIEDEQDAIEDIQDKLEALVEVDKSINEGIDKLRAKEVEIKRENNALQQQYHMENSRLMSIVNITERYDGFGQSIRKVMEQQKNYKGIHGVVADVMKVPHEYETAIETALGGQIQNIVTDTEKTAKELIAFLKKNKFGRATFLPLDSIRPSRNNFDDRIFSEKGVIGKANELVEVKAEYNTLMEYLLGRVLVVDDIDNALSIANKYRHSVRMVTLGGEILNPGGSLSGGAYKNSSNLLGRRREIDALKEKVKELEGKLSESKKALNDIRDQIKREEDKITGNSKLRQDISLELNTHKVNFERAKADLKKCEDELKRINLDAKEVEDARAEIKASLAKIDEKLKVKTDFEKECDDQKKELTLEKKNLNVDLNEVSEGLKNIDLDINRISQSIDFASENMVRVDSELKNLTRELEELIDSKENSAEKIDEKKEEIKAKESLIEETKKNIEELKEKEKAVKAKGEDLRNKNKEFLAIRDEIVKEISSLEKEGMRLDSQREKIDNAVSNYIEYMWEEYELTYKQACELKTEERIDSAELKKRINQLKSLIKGLGSVNVNAIERSKEINERYELLSTQHDDIVKAAETLEDIIKELDEKMRKTFSEEFEKINNSFNQVFKELFGGGRGNIEIDKDSDILTAAITIIAQPPGKKLQNMMQLSGGEKALTAISLLFAIQQLKPSPFCLLDEIEAALDDSNVDRFADYLHKLTADTQFIVITHRRGTMNAADILYGITMQEKGVSTLISVDLVDAENYIEDKKEVKEEKE
ncbi:MAG: chromosome segregation protein SMC [Lachnospiraceae bacterium]|nr:chromosome segregation protein SMC [Lachnospiraceae bacterium]